MKKSENVSDQLEGLVKEIAVQVQILQRNSNCTIEQATEIVKIAIESQRNDVLWRRLKELNDNIEELSNNLEEMADNICNN